MIKYCATLLAVKDMERSLRFYKDIFDQEVVVDLGKNKILSCGLTLQEDFDELKTFPWRQRGIRIFDPDGHLIEVSESMYSIAGRYFKEGKNIEETAGLLMQPLHLVEEWHEYYKTDGQ